MDAGDHDLRNRTRRPLWLWRTEASARRGSAALLYSTLDRQFERKPDLADQRALGSIAGAATQLFFRPLLDDAGVAANHRTWAAGRGRAAAGPVHCGRGAWRFSKAGWAALCRGHARLDEQRDSGWVVSTRALHGQEGVRPDCL